MLCHGDREAAPALERIVGAIVEHGEAEVTKALSRALSRQRRDLLALAQIQQPESARI